MKIAGNKNKNTTGNKTIVIAIVAVLVVVALVVALIVLLPSKKDESDKSTTTKSNAPITGISIDPSTKNTYRVDEEFDPSTVVIKVDRKDGTSTLINGSDPEVTFSELDTSYPHDCTIDVAYKGKYTTFDVSVKNPPVEVMGTVTGITILSTPKSFYYVGDTFDPSGIIAAISIEESVDPIIIDGLHPELEITGFDSSTPVDELPITLTFRGVSTSYNVAIRDESYAEYIILSLTIVNKPLTTYSVNQSFDPAGIKIQVNTDKQDTTFFVDDPKKLTFSGFDSSAPAENQVITVTYEGVSTTFTVTIKDNTPARQLVSVEIKGVKQSYTISEWQTNGLNIDDAYWILTYDEGEPEKVAVLDSEVPSLPWVESPMEIVIVLTYGNTNMSIAVPITITE